MPIFVKVGGVWKNIDYLATNNLGTWKEVTEAFVKDSGVWKSTYKGAFGHTATISSPTANFDLLTRIQQDGWDGTSDVQSQVTIAAPVVMYSTSTGTGAVTIPDGFPAGSQLTITNAGTWTGKGGNGGNGRQAWPIPSIGQGSSSGLPGGVCLDNNISTPGILNIDNQGTIAGGGGGGGGGGNHYVSILIPGPPIPGPKPAQQVPAPYQGFSRMGGGGGGGGAGTSLSPSSGGAGRIGRYQGNRKGTPSETDGSISATGGQAGNDSAGSGGAGGPRVYPPLNPPNQPGGPGGSGGARGAGGGAGTSRPPNSSPVSLSGRPGGGAGSAVQGNSTINWISTGTRQGPIV